MGFAVGLGAGACRGYSSGSAERSNRTPPPGGDWAGAAAGPYAGSGACPGSGEPPESVTGRSVGRCMRVAPELSDCGACGHAAPSAPPPSAGAEGRGTPPLFIVSVGVSCGGAATADRSYPQAPQKRSPDSSGSAQLGHFDRAACWCICDINYTHVRGR